MTTETLIRLYEPKKTNHGTCNGCGAAIDWYETVKSSKNMPMNAGAVPRKSENHPENGRVIVFMASSDSHWPTCPKRSQFK